MSRQPAYNAGHHCAVVRGMAETFWASAWADHVERVGCRSLSRLEITSVMPAIPAEAYALAERWLGCIEQASNATWPILWIKACLADGTSIEGDTLPTRTRRDSLQRFGNCLAFMVMGDGVSWFDDHEKFELTAPYDAGGVGCELEPLADAQCEDCRK